MTSGSKGRYELLRFARPCRLAEALERSHPWSTRNCAPRAEVAEACWALAAGSKCACFYLLWARQLNWFFAAWNPDLG